MEREIGLLHLRAAYYNNMFCLGCLDRQIANYPDPERVKIVRPAPRVGHEIGHNSAWTGWSVDHRMIPARFAPRSLRAVTARI